ncbi:hypothetical protein CYY_000238 [Polysphondylium violaceum]|uniref:Uncharacterized protein n=1 Tax=Polysphondylium violaceum TaxID=133409 RepID=A0A8J4Q204_9MYCE|nr:hypothetical protein CYY_000238 [Polysphondylium violaceum]
MCQDLVINVDDQYLKDNHQYLSAFTNTDKLNHRIFIHYTDSKETYLTNPFRYLVNDVYLFLGDIDQDEHQVCKHNLDQFVHAQVHKLDLGLNVEFLTGQLPESLTYLNLSTYKSPPFVQEIMSNLPFNLKKLVLTSGDYNFASNSVPLPESVTDLEYYGTLENLKSFVVPPNKVFKNCELQLDSVEALEWLQENQWVNNVSIDSPKVLIGLTIPSHVKTMNFYGDISAEVESSFPLMLESFTCYDSVLLCPALFTNLRSLTSWIFEAKLERNFLPQSLEHLDIHYTFPLEAGVLPNLTSLVLNLFNHPLDIGVLPSSLTSLKLPQFMQSLKPYALPNKLEQLQMYFINQPTIACYSLPDSLTLLKLNNFKGSFELCQPLNHLKILHLNTIYPSVSTLLPNIKRLDLILENTDELSGTCLVNTCIESLSINCKSVSFLYANSLPSTLKYLTLSNIYIQSNDVIPESCIYLKAYWIDINPEFIPQSVNYFYTRSSLLNK